MEEKKFDLVHVKRDLFKAITECSDRGLYHSVKWLSELNYSISHIKLEPNDYPSSLRVCGSEYEAYLIAKSYFDLKEYDRCAYFTENCVTAKARFIHLYAKYLSIEKKKLDTMTDINCPPDLVKNNALRDLRSTLEMDHCYNKLDGYCLYLYGIVLKKLDLINPAIDIFVEAIKVEPFHWGAWQELALLIPDKNKLNTLNLPDVWMKSFFLAHLYLEQLDNEEALQIVYDLCLQGFDKSTYLIAQMAIAYHNRRGTLIPNPTN
jgi:anaphase-promoting complex subunit 8